MKTWKKGDIAAGGDKALKVMSAQSIGITLLIQQAAVILLSAHGSLFPSAEALMSIMSTFAAIIASLYGITLAGYTFFLSRMDALVNMDTTVDFIVDSIKKRFKILFWVIAVNVVVTLLTTMVLMYMPAPEGENSHYFYRMFCNEFVLSVIISIALILYYSILVINPNCIEKEAARLKKKLSPLSFRVGDVNEFIIVYDQIVTLCNGMVSQAVLMKIHENKGQRFSYTIALLRENRPELRPMLLDLLRIHRYYQCTVNCKTLSVSQDLCSLAEKTLARLEQLAQQEALPSP